MGKRLSKSDLELYNTIDQILWKDWDPIGVYNTSGIARDEYYSYLPKVYEMVKTISTKDEIAHYLFSVETLSMGLSGNKKKCEKIALKLSSLKIK